MPDVSLSAVKEARRRIEAEQACVRVGSMAWYDLQWEHESLSDLVNDWRGESARAHVRLHADTWLDRLRWWLRVLVRFRFGP